ncbi:MAG: MCE family protein [Actinobacteria bacterium]|nr:MCE family protein [Actinomycetota bacterium]
MRARRGRVTAIAVALVLALAGAGAACGIAGSGDREVEAEFARAFNLFPGSDVRVLGLTVGRVLDVTAPEDRGVVRVRLQLDDDVDLPADVRAHVVQGSLLGERFVELEPVHTGGPLLAAGATIPVERTTVPAEFDEILESLNDVLVALPPDELARLVRNTAAIVDGRGERIGRLLDDVAVAVDALHEADDELVDLVAELAALNATLGTRAGGIERTVEDYATLMSVLADERRTIEDALSEVAATVLELRRVAEDHAGRLDETVEGVTRVGRTLSRNLDRIHLTLEGQSELFRHAERVFDFDQNWLPLVNHSQDVGRMIQDRLAQRLVGLCDRLGREDCADTAWWEAELPASVCIRDVVTCRDPAVAGTDELTLEDTIGRAVARVPELVDAVAAGRAAAQLGLRPLPGGRR